MEDHSARSMAGPVFVLGTMALVAFRLVLKLDFIDPSTGFYQGTDGVVERVFDGVYLLVLFLLLISAHIGPTGVSGRVVPSLRPVCAAAAVFGLCNLLQASGSGFALWTRMRSGEGMPAVELVLNTSALVVSVASGVVLIVLAVNMGGGWLEGYPRSVALALPILSQCFLLIERFTARTSPMSISDDVYGEALAVFAILFLTGHARVLARYHPNGGRRLLEFAGYGCAMTALILVVPQVVGMAAGRLVVSVPAVCSAAFDASLALYSVAFTRRVAG